MKVVQCNAGYSGYWLACWQELMQRVTLRVFTPETNYPYKKNVICAFPIQVLNDKEMADNTLSDAVAAESPDVVVIGGWASRSFVNVAFDSRLKDVPKILAIDAAWEGSLKQCLNRFRLHKFIKRFDAIIVGGMRGRTYARWLGFKDSCIYRSIYGYDAAAFDDCYSRRASLNAVWPHRFCYIGRYTPIKGVDVLIRAYQLYKSQVYEPWPLDCYGSGELRSLLTQIPGAVDHGFLQPTDLPLALVSEGAFIFPSLHEPWGVAAVEAAGAGLPMICSDMVTSADDVVRHGENGYIVKTGDVQKLCDAMVRLHNMSNELPKMGAISKSLASDFAPKPWADRWMEVFHAVSR